MAPTPVLAHLPYTRQVLAGLGTTIGRTRFMRIAHETEVHARRDPRRAARRAFADVPTAARG